MTLVAIVDTNQYLVDVFLSKLIVGKNTFRYFDKRPLSVMERHVITLVGLDDDKNPIAYGHLDKENDTLWLGVAVVDDMQRKGIGSQMVGALINYAISKNEPVISLSVDKENKGAILLYEKFNFVKIDENEQCLFYRQDIIL